MQRFCFLFSLTLFFVFSSEPLSAQQNIGGAGDHHLDAAGHIKAGPHLSGDDYVGLRPQKTYEVLQFDLSHAGDNENAQFEITIGPDFAVEQIGTLITIYDFRFRRILTLSENTAKFSNDSLFGLWHQRWAFLQNNLRTFGVFAAFKDSANPELERYWIEQLNGLNHPQDVAYESFPKPVLRSEDNDGARVFFVGEQKVAEVSFGEAKFPSAAHGRSYGAWLVRSQGIHPQMAAALAAGTNLPSAIEKMAKEDITSEPVSSLTTMVTVEVGKSGLDFIAGRQPATPSWEPRFPESLGELMVAAARGEAPNGPLSGKDYERELRDAKKKGDALNVALLAIHASMGCDEQQPEPAICAIATNALREVFSDENVKTWFNAMQLDQQGEHAAGARIIIGLTDLRPERIDILNIMLANMLVEAKKKSQLDDALKKRFEDLPQLFEEAFARDPYAPPRYRDYYNYLHASTTSTDEAYMVSTMAYPVIDLARSIPERNVPNIVSSVSDVEQSIAKDFSAHFPNVVGPRAD